MYFSRLKYHLMSIYHVFDDVVAAVLFSQCDDSNINLFIEKCTYFHGVIDLCEHNFFIIALSNKKN